MHFNPRITRSHIQTMRQRGDDFLMYTLDLMVGTRDGCDPGRPHINSSKPNQTLFPLKFALLCQPQRAWAGASGHARGFLSRGRGRGFTTRHMHGLTSVAGWLAGGRAGGLDTRWPTLTSRWCTRSQIALRNKAVSLQGPNKKQPLPPSHCAPLTRLKYRYKLEAD